MEPLERLKLRTNETNDALLTDLLESAKAAILARRFPYGEQPLELEPRYLDLQVRIAQDLYNRVGAEGETAHSENGVSRSWGAENISTDLLGEVIPIVGAAK